MHLVKLNLKPIQTRYTPTPALPIRSLRLHRVRQGTLSRVSAAKNRPLNMCSISSRRTAPMTRFWAICQKVTATRHFVFLATRLRQTCFVLFSCLFCWFFFLLLSLFVL